MPSSMVQKDGVTTNLVEDDLLHVPDGLLTPGFA